MDKRSTKVNVLASLLLQIVTILNGFIIPRIILSYFGSEVNGLVASLSQFLNYITLLEGGVSGVIMASLYKPLAEKNDQKVSGILKATNGFFRKIALIFIVYSAILAVVYPFIVKTSFSWAYIFSLTLILAASLFTQYFFALTFRLLLIADRRGAIVSFSQIVFVLLNLALVLVSIKILPSIHILKFMSLIAYITQPIIYSLYVNKHYHIDKQASEDKEAIKQRWDGFGQNIAYFIHTNTDMVVLTIFISLSEVSVYAVYFMVINSLKNLVMSMSTAIAPSLGNVLASDNKELKNKNFDLYEYGMGFITVFMFLTASFLIVPFVLLYTKGIEDANYCRPLFAILLLLAEAIYCYRDPYIAAAYSSGHFKQTAKYAYIEAGMNILISVVLVNIIGIEGVAVGTLVSMLYRAIVHILYLKDRILYRPVYKSIKTIIPFLVTVSICCLVDSFLLPASINSWIEWFITACITAVIVGCSLVFSNVIFSRNMFFSFITRIVKR